LVALQTMAEHVMVMFFEMTYALFLLKAHFQSTARNSREMDHHYAKGYGRIEGFDSYVGCGESFGSPEQGEKKSVGQDGASCKEEKTGKT